MRWWLPTEIELHHYQQRSEEEFVKRRSYQMKGLEAAKQEQRRTLDDSGHILGTDLGCANQGSCYRKKDLVGSAACG